MRWRGVERERVQSEWQLEVTPHAGHAEDALRKRFLLLRLLFSDSETCSAYAVDDTSRAWRRWRWRWWWW
ncbi:hypothetical protein COCVIDRAFT_93358 [Bipolaris victoriae FI3]|uniref:Uncharacterized protein n=1 Tax=Bipolaris victoriae (strain FI3) TaxID=930091 RepID=W7EFB0_BIPV3|nr:hypothetical protein COCVIDRAFT_93358 [Bipolaris victoriae FI3]